MAIFRPIPQKKLSPGAIKCEVLRFLDAWKSSIIKCNRQSDCGLNKKGQDRAKGMQKMAEGRAANGIARRRAGKTMWRSDRGKLSRVGLRQEARQGKSGG